MYDMIITGGIIADGTGNALYESDIAVKDGIIASIASEIAGEADITIDASGKIVSPGFIDIHSHSDIAPLVAFLPESKVYQGVTFELCGNCGDSLVPCKGKNAKEAMKHFLNGQQYPFQGIDIKVSDMDDYVKAAEKNTIATNYGMMVGHSSLRACVMGFENRKPSLEEMEEMKALLASELQKGAFGMSLGLIYAPGSFAEKEEILELAKVVAAYGGFVSVHMRNEGPGVFGAVKEMLEIAEESGVHLHISHLKIMTSSLWGSAEKLLCMIDDAKKKGINITCDQYPYHASATTLSALLPKWAKSGTMEERLYRVKHPEENLIDEIKKEMASRGGADHIMISLTHNKHTEWEGSYLSDLSEEFGTDPVDAVLHILICCEFAVSCIYFSQSMEDVKMILKREDIAVGSDGYNFPYDRNILTARSPHPRNFAAFPHALEVIREEKLMPVQKAVYKMTGLPAGILGLNDRGKIKEGYIADITVFDPLKTAQTGDYRDSVRKPQGIDTVITGGKVVMQGGKITAERPGKVIRREGGVVYENV